MGSVGWGQAFYVVSKSVGELGEEPVVLVELAGDVVVSRGVGEQATTDPDAVGPVVVESEAARPPLGARASKLEEQDVEVEGLLEEILPPTENGLHDLALNAGREAVAGQFVELVEVLVQGFRAEGHIGDSGVFHAKGRVAAGIVAFVAEAVQPPEAGEFSLDEPTPGGDVHSSSNEREACVRAAGRGA